MSASTASEWLINAFNGIAGHLASLTLAEVAINLAFSVGIALVAFGLAYGLQRLMRQRVENLPEPGVAQRVRSSRAVRFGAAVFRAALTLAAVWLILGVWGFDPGAWVRGGAGEAAVRLIGRLVLLLMIAIAAFEVVGFVIDRGMGRLAARAHEPRRTAQIHTLSPIIKAILRGAVIILAAMMLLSEVGVKIGPLLAGAGVVGVAIGFGAQTLVKDFLTGLFFVLEDIVSVGDTVRIGNCKGHVESMTLRTIRLRDFDGTLHVFPYSEAQVVHNETKTFSYAVVDLHIANDADVDAALEAMGEVGRELAADPALAAKILGPVEVVGVEGVTEAGLRLRARIKTLRREDPAVQREFYRRVKAAFDKRGVALPSASMRLIMPDGSPAAPNFASKH